MFTTDFLVSGISALDENIVVQTFEKEKLQEVSGLAVLSHCLRLVVKLKIWAQLFKTNDVIS